MLKHIADEDFQTYTYQKSHLPISGLACQLCSEFTSNDRPAIQITNVTAAIISEQTRAISSHIQQW